MKPARIARHLTMTEVADVLGVRDYQRPNGRAEYVRRLIRRMERRDAATYLRRDGRTWLVSLEDLERARPWAPGTLGGIRSGLGEVAEEVKTLKKRVNSHGRRISVLEEWRKLTDEYIFKISQLR